jgi:hypothetical protein
VTNQSRFAMACGRGLIRIRKLSGLNVSSKENHNPVLLVVDLHDDVNVGLLLQELKRQDALYRDAKRSIVQFARLRFCQRNQLLHRGSLSRTSGRQRPPEQPTGVGTRVFAVAQQDFAGHHSSSHTRGLLRKSLAAGR